MVIGQNSPRVNKKLLFLLFLEANVLSKKNHAKRKEKLKNGAFSCVGFCLRSLLPFYQTCEGSFQNTLLQENLIWSL